VNRTRRPAGAATPAVAPPAPVRYHILDMRVGVLQTEPVFGDPTGNIDRALALAERGSADLWVLPELFATGYQFASAEEVHALAEPVPDGPTTARLSDFCRRKECSVYAGLAEVAGDAVYNAAVLIGPEGFLARYRKIHLFADEKTWFRPGDRPFPVVDIGVARVGLMVCFDHFFPESARTLALRGADILLHAANLVMPGIARRTMVVRAMENGVFAVTANRVGVEHRTSTPLRFTGESQIVSPNGDVLLRLSPDRVQMAVVEIDPLRARNKSLGARNDRLADRRPDAYIA